MATAPHPAEFDVDAEFARMVDELSRRGFLAGGVGAAALLGLSACGSSGSPARRGPASPGRRRVSSVNGDVEVPDDPRRVVTLDGFSMAAMFDLGLAPVGVYSAGEQYVEPQFLTKWRSIAKISDGTVGGSIDLEKVAALHPDLIIGIDGQKPPYAQLQDIAPTVILPFNASAAPWRDMAEDTAVALGRTNAFQALQQRYAARAAQLRSQYASVLTAVRWDVLQGGFDNGQFWLYGPHSPIGSILADAGARFAAASTSVAGSAAQQSLSYERIGRLGDADAIFYYETNDGRPANLGPQLFAQPAWTRLRAATGHRLFGSVYFLPSGYSDAFGALDSLEAALKRLQGPGSGH